MCQGVGQGPCVINYDLQRGPSKSPLRAGAEGGLELAAAPRELPCTASLRHGYTDTWYHNQKQQHLPSTASCTSCPLHSPLPLVDL